MADPQNTQQQDVDNGPAQISVAEQPSSPEQTGPGGIDLSHATRVENGVAYNAAGQPIGQASVAPKVDYKAIAAQMGGAPVPPKIDYKAVAAQMGGMPSAPATKTAPEQTSDLLTKLFTGNETMMHAGGQQPKLTNAELAQAKNASDYIYNNILHKDDYQHNNLAYSDTPTTFAGKVWQRLWGWATQDEINKIPGLEPDRVTMLRQSGNDILSRILGGKNASDLRQFIEGGYSLPIGPYGNTMSSKMLDPIAEPEVYARAAAKSLTDFFSPGYYALGAFGKVAQAYQKSAQVAANAGDMAAAAKAMGKAKLLGLIGAGINVPFAASQAHDLVENWANMNVPERIAAISGILGASLNAHIGIQHMGGYSQAAADAKNLAQDIGQSKSAQAVRNAVGSMVTLGKAQTFDEALQRGSSLTSKKFRQQQAHIREASPELQAVALENPQAETPGQFADGIRRWLQEREQVMLRASGGTKESDVPVSPDLEQEVRQRLDRFFDENRGKYGNDEQVEAAREKLMQRLLLQSKDPNAPPSLRMPNAFETENIRQGLNQEIKPQLGGEPTSNAYRAAVQQTLPILREALDSFYHDKGVKNVKEFRSKEATMIDVADRLEAAEKRAQEMGNPSIWGTLARRFSVPTIITSIALGHNPLAFGALAPYLISERAYHNYKNPGVNIRRAIDLAEPKPITDIEQVPRSPMQGPSAGAPGSVPPGITPPIHPTKAGQAAAAVAAATMPEPATNHPLNAQLATHFGEPLDHASLDDRIERVKNDAEAMRRSGVDLAKTNTGKMLGMINEHESEHAAKIEAEQQKAHEDAAKVAQELHDEFQKLQEENRQKLTGGKLQPEQTAFALPYETTDEELPASKVAGKTYSGFNTRLHELGHLIWSHMMGLQPFDVLSASHPDATGAHAVARTDISRLLNPDGTTNSNAFKQNLGDLISRFLAGAVAEDVHGGVPMEQNTSAKTDVTQVNKMLDALEVPEADRKRIIQQAVAQLRETFTRPDVAEIMNAFASKRKAGLSPEYHFDETQVHQLRQALDNATKGETKGESYGKGTKETGLGFNKGVGGAGGRLGEKPVAGREGGNAPEAGRLNKAAASLVERSTGDEDIDAAIRNGGGVPAGFMNVPGHGDYRMFHDPETGSTLAFKPHEAITPQTVGKKMAASRAEFEAGNRREAARQIQSAQAKRSLSEEASADLITSALDTGNYSHFEKGSASAEDVEEHRGYLLGDGSFLGAKEGFDTGDPDATIKTHGDILGDLGGDAMRTANAIRVAGNNMFEVYSRPTESQLSEIARLVKNGGDRKVVWDFFDGEPTGEVSQGELGELQGKHVTTGHGSIGDFRRAIDKQFPEKTKLQSQQTAEASVEEEPEMERLRRLSSGVKTPEAIAAEAAEQAKTAYVKRSPELRPLEQSTEEKLKEKYGTTKEPLKAGFILPKGEMVPLQGEHDGMLSSIGYKADVSPREDFIEKEGAIRTRFRKSRAGDEVVFSVPSSGVTKDQVEQMKKSVAAMGRYGNVVMEVGDRMLAPVRNTGKEFARPSDIEPMLRLIGAHPEIKLQPEQAATDEWKKRVAETPWSENRHGRRQLNVKDASGYHVGELVHDGSPGDLYSRIRSSHLKMPWRNQGIAKEMYKSAIEDARKMGIQEFRSDTTVSNDAQNVWKALARDGYPVHYAYTGNFNANGGGGVEYSIPLQGQKITDADFRPLAALEMQPRQNAPAPAVAEGADKYNEKSGRPAIDATVKSHSPEFAKRVADAFDAMKHEPNNPEVRKSYEAMADEVRKQWDYATKEMGVKFEPWTKEGQPYANSKEMVNDVRDNKHLYFFQGGDIKPESPMAKVDPDTGLSYNDMFRAVHDLFGHAAHGFEFGPKGEENAYLVHRQMFPAEAIPALTSETRGQNSWVNFGKHLRNAEGNVAKKGEAGYIPPIERPYAEQKVGLLPEEFHQINPQESANKTVVVGGRRLSVNPDDTITLYHGTSANNVDSMLRDGIKIGSGEKWQGSLAENSKGKAFVIQSKPIAWEYAGTHSGDTAVAHIEVPREWAQNKLKADTKEGKSVFSIDGIPSQFIKSIEINRKSTPKTPYEFPTTIKKEKIENPTFGQRQDWADFVAKNFKTATAGGINPNNPEAESKRYGLELMPEVRNQTDKAPTAEDLRAYAKRPEVKEALAKHPDIKLGWDLGGAKPELNVGVSTNDKDTALDVAKKLDQRAMWDNKEEKEIPVGGEGKKTAFPEYPLEDRLKDLGKLEKAKEEPKEFAENPEGFKHIAPEVLQHLEPDEQAFIKGNKRSQQLIQEAYDGIKPTMDETKAVIQAGQALGGWWRRYIDAFNALGEHTNQELASKLGPKHADALKIWHAAVSGNKPIEAANKIAWGSYADWLDKGKPRDRASIDRILADNGGVTDTHFPKSSKKAGQVKKEGLDTTKLFRLVNSPQMREINPSPFHGDVFDPNNPSPIYGITSGARKIPSMGATVAGEGNLNRLVLDTHMKDYFGENKWTDNKYLAFSAHLRQAARELGLQPGEGQEQLWGTVLGIKKLLYEGLPDSEIPDELTNDLIEGIGKDYAQIIKDDPELSDIFERLKAHGIDPGGNDAQKRLAAILEGKRPVQKAPVDQARLAESAARIRKNLKDVPEPTNELSFKFGANALKLE